MIETNFTVKSLDADIPLVQYRLFPKNPIYFILENLRSAFNVGAIFRLGDALRVRAIYLCGYTATPPHVKLARTSMGAVDYVPWEYFKNAREALLKLKENHISVFAAETTTSAIPYNKLDYPSPVGIVFGNEALGIERATLALCDKLIEIPMNGFKNSLNVATAAAVIGYKILETPVQGQE
jgi:23S rRNA (guanosine2251-2'-O)-methyltransferase